MIETLRETILSFWLFFDEELEITELWLSYKEIVLHFFIILMAFFLGRFLGKRNQFEKYMNQFNISAHNLESLKKSNKFYGRIKRFLNFSFLFIPLISSLVFYLLNTEHIHKREFKLKQKLLFLYQDSVNWIIIVANVFFFVLYIATTKLISLKLDQTGKKIQSLNSCKSIYVEKFFDLLGDEMKMEIKKYLLKRNTSEERRIELLDQDNKEAMKELKKLKKICSIEVKRNIICKEFIQKIISFEWCDFCYNSTGEIKKNSELEEPKEDQNKIENNELSGSDANVSPQNAKDTKVEDSELLGRTEILSRKRCSKKCLVKFLSLCEFIGHEYVNKLKDI